VHCRSAALFKNVYSIDFVDIMLRDASAGTANLNINELDRLNDSSETFFRIGQFSRHHGRPLDIERMAIRE
jgi:hypothetical protein